MYIFINTFMFCPIVFVVWLFFPFLYFFLFFLKWKWIRCLNHEGRSGQPVPLPVPLHHFTRLRRTVLHISIATTGLPQQANWLFRVIPVETSFLLVFYWELWLENKTNMRSSPRWRVCGAAGDLWPGVWTGCRADRSDTGMLCCQNFYWWDYFLWETKINILTIRNNQIFLTYLTCKELNQSIITIQNQHRVRTQTRPGQQNPSHRTRFLQNIQQEREDLHPVVMTTSQHAVWFLSGLKVQMVQLQQIRTIRTDLKHLTENRMNGPD